MVKLLAAGGIGNQLFQYALARRLAKARGSQLTIDTRFYEPDAEGGSKGFWLDRMPIKARIVRHPATGPLRAHAPWRRAWRKLAETLVGRLYQETEPGYDEAVLRLPANAILSGYFQSYRYLLPRDPEIDAELDLSGFLEPSHQAVLERIRAERLVSVHVRRGDYVGDPDFELDGLDAYLAKALAAMRERVPTARFLVFSDDVDWCRQHPLFQNDCEVFDPPPGLVDAGSLYLMSECAHHVIANSSFSWWGAWLKPGEKVVVAPSRWVKGLSAEQMQITPPFWLSI